MAKPPPFRADQVGSLLRPQRLIDARAAFKAGEIDRAALTAVEDDCIAEAVRGQEATGIPTITDGEFRRENWWLEFIAAMPGIEIGGGDQASHFAGGHYVPLNVAVAGRIDGHAPVLVRDYEYLAGLTDRTVKITVPSPSRIHYHGGDAAVTASGAYTDLDAFWDDVAAFYRAEIAALEAAGCRYIQIDDPMMSYFVDDAHRAKMTARGMDPDTTLARYVAAINACIRDRGPDTTLALHICRGNARSSWVATGGYARIADIVFPALKVDALFLEYDDDRSGDFAPLALVPDEVAVVLGLLSTKVAELEDKGAIRRRIDEAAGVVPMERLGVSPQCGFASVLEGNLLSEDDQWRKLALALEISEVWDEA